MTDRELMQMALDAMRAVSVDEHLCNAAHHVKKDRHGIDEPCPIAKRFNDIAEALRARLAQPERKWQGLTDDEILEEYRQSYGDDGNLTDVYFARAIEAKLREKNND